MQRTAFYDNRRHNTAAVVDLRFDNLSFRSAVVVGFEFQQFRLQGDGFKQFVHTLPVKG